MLTDQNANLLLDVLQLIIESADVNEGLLDIADLREHIETAKQRILDTKEN